MSSRRKALAMLVAAGAVAWSAFGSAVSAAEPREIRIDYATYNPVSLVLRDQRFLEDELKADGIGVRWVQSLGSNKALEFLNAGSIDFGSTAGAAALIARVNGNPLKSIYVYSRPEWTALVTRKDTGLKFVAELKGRRVAVTRGTDPHIFLVRALAGAGLTERDVKLVLLQHPDGRTALDRGDVDAWAGLDPIMAAAEIENGDVLFFRDKAANTWGVLNVREEFANEHPALVRRVLKAYERARLWALAHPDELKRILVAATGLPQPVIERQLERTELTHSTIGEPQRDTITKAGLALRDAGVLPAGTDVGAAMSALIDERYGAGTQ
jgi:sulfonate transport system substrate-binding protein